MTKMPMFTKAEMNEHITRSGKYIANKDHHSVPTSLRKAKTFLEDEYQKTYVKRKLKIQSWHVHPSCKSGTRMVVEKTFSRNQSWRLL